MITIYTDGSARGNGKADAEGGYGVVVCNALDSTTPFEEYEIIDVYAQRESGTTNNRMEMKAILWALENYGVSYKDFYYPFVFSDSAYAVNAFTKWIHNWKRNNWTRAKGKPIENLDLIKQWDDLYSSGSKMINLRHIPGHAGNIWNELADSLATGKVTPQQVLRDKKVLINA